jgi:DNA-binding transcriptional ArsR family regulator
MKETLISEELQIDAAQLKSGAQIFRALNHNLRLTILQLIHKNKRMKVTAVYTTLNIEQSVASQHLGILRKAGIVKTERENRFIYYSVNYDALQHVQNQAAKLLNR